MKHRLTRQEYLNVLALWVLAKKEAKMVFKYEQQANDILGSDWGSHLSDSIYDEGVSVSEVEFNKILNKMKIEFEKQ